MNRGCVCIVWVWICCRQVMDFYRFSARLGNSLHAVLHRAEYGHAMLPFRQFNEVRIGETVGMGVCIFSGACVGDCCVRLVVGRA